MSDLLREEPGKVVMPTLLREDEKQTAKISSKKMSTRNYQKTMPGLSNKPSKPTEV